LFLLTVVASLSCVLYAAPQRETVQQRLLRTVQIGAPQGIGVPEIKRMAEDPNIQYSTAILARSALLVLQQDQPRLVPYGELLDSALNNLALDSNAFQPPPGLSDFRGKETVLTMVYAMVMSGNQEQVTDLLEKHEMTGSKYKQAVVLSALRNIGTPRAVGLIQKYAERGQESNLAQTTLADEDYPVLFELHDRWNMVPPPQRTRDRLRQMVESGCDQRTAMASYWLGFFSRNPDHDQEEAELDALRAVLRKHSATCEMMEHVIALKAIGLRTRASASYWTTLARRTKNVWERHQVVINAWGRWGRSFAPAALELLKREPAQYVQWELLNGNLQTRQGHVYRDLWDIWLPVNVLVLMEFPEGGAHRAKPGMSKEDVNDLLRWLESGARPRDPWVSNHMLYNLCGLVSGEDTRRLLRIFNAHPERNKNWWIVARLEDPDALPLLEYWSSLPAPQDQAEMLKARVNFLQSRSRSHRSGAAGCCQATEACLLEQLDRIEPLSAGIHSDEEARHWLARGRASAGEFTIHYTDPLQRSAVVRSKDGREQRWEYLYDCWRNTDPNTKSNAVNPR
jgi:hypothetical protein